MSDLPEVQRVGDHIIITGPANEIVVHVDHIIEFIKSVFTATTGREFKEDTEI